MDLPRDLAEANRPVQIVARRVLNDRFNFGVCHPALAKVVERLLDQFASHPAALELLCNTQIRDVTDPRRLILGCRDNSEDGAIDFRHKKCSCMGYVAGSINNGTIRDTVVGVRPLGHCGLSTGCFPGLVEVRPATAYFRFRPGQLKFWFSA